MDLQVITDRQVLGQNLKVFGSVEDPLFLAKDVAEWIDYAKTGSGKRDISHMLRQVDEDEKLVRTFFVPGQQRRDMWFLTENGLYEVLMLSRKPIAKQFKSEVKKILKEIRLNKGYVVKGYEPEFVKNAFSFLSPETMGRVMTELQAQNVVLRDENEALDAKIEALDTKVQILEDKVMELTSRSFIVAAIRRFGVQQFRGEIPIRIINGWRTYYGRLLYSQYGICINGRKILRTEEKLTGQAQRLAYLTEDELPFAVQLAVSLCDEYGIDISDYIQGLRDPLILIDCEDECDYVH